MVQTEIEESPNYPQLVKQLNIVKIDGIMRCKGRLSIYFSFDILIFGIIV